MAQPPRVIIVPVDEPSEFVLPVVEALARHAGAEIDLVAGDGANNSGHDWILLVGPRCQEDESSLRSWLHGPVNVFIDGSDADAYSVETGVRWANAVGQPVVFTGILPPGCRTCHPLVEMLAEYVATARDGGLEASFRIAVSFDLVGTMVRTARDYGGSIVVGTHHQNALARKLAGSVAVGAGRHALCPVLVAA